jgi:hypothetical protein
MARKRGKKMQENKDFEYSDEDIKNKFEKA